MLVLTILKYVALAFLWLLAALFVLLCMVLFIPVKYSGQARFSYGEPAADADFTYALYFRWLFRFLTFSVIRNKEQQTATFKILGRPMGKRKKTEHHGDREESGPKQSDADSMHASKEKQREKLPEESEPEEKKPDKPASPPMEKPGENRDEGAADVDREGIIDRIQDILNKVKYYYDYPDRDEIIKLTVKLVKDLYRMNKPAHIHVTALIGAVSPDITGYAVGALSIIAAILPISMDIQGVYDKEIINLEMHGKGGFSVFTLLWPLIVYGLSRPIWKIIRGYLFKDKKNKAYERNESYV